MITTIHGNEHTTKQLVAVIMVTLLGMLAMISPASAQYGTMSYQGMLKNGGSLVNGYVDLEVTYYYVGSGLPRLSESFVEVPVTNGVFNIELGSQVGGLPEMLDLTQPIELGIRINESDELSPRTQLHAVPYAITSHTLDGIPASLTPAPGTLFPLPLDAYHHISSSILPPFEGITTVAVGNGLVGGGSTGLVDVKLDSGNVPGNYIQNGSITGLQMSPDFAGNGVSLDPAGTLAVRIDTNQFEFLNGKLHGRTDAPFMATNGTLTNLEVAGTVHLNTDGESPTTIGGALFVSGGIDVQYQPIANVGDPVREDDAVNARYVRNRIGAAIASIALPIPKTGTLWVYNTSDKKQKSATVTLYDPAITLSSVILLTVQAPTPMGSAPSPATATCYSASFRNLQEGSVDVTIAKNSGDFDSEEGGTVHYIIYNNDNNQEQPNN